MIRNGKEWVLRLGVASFHKGSDYIPLADGRQYGQSENDGNLYWIGAT